jgi:hypothetical protein
MAAVIFLWQRDGWMRWVGMGLFGLTAAVAASISPAGLMLYMLPLGLLVGTLWWTVSIRGKEFWELSILWRGAGQALLPFVILVLAAVYLAISRPGGESVLSLPAPKPAAPFASGMFEVACLEDPVAYASIINERAANGYAFDGPAMMKRYPGIAEAAYERLPFRARLVAWGRLSGWGLFLPRIETYSGDPLNVDYGLRTRFKNEAVAEDVRSGINDVMRQTGVAVHVMEKHSNRQLVAYNTSILPVYSWFYRVLLFAALAGWMIGLGERKYLAAVLVLPFLLKVLLHVLTLDVSSEYVQSLDACLWLGALAGLICVNPKAMQKPTDESDRRFLPPIRPKRLLTRHKDVPGTTGLPMDS